MTIIACECLMIESLVNVEHASIRTYAKFILKISAARNRLTITSFVHLVINHRSIKSEPSRGRLRASLDAVFRYVSDDWITRRFQIKRRSDWDHAL